MSRRLRPEEMDLWRQVARTATPLAPAPPRPAPAPQTIERPAPPVLEPPKPIAPFVLGETAGRRGSTRDVLPAPPAPSAVTMDTKAYGKLKRGKLTPEARIDLHGLTVDRAHGALLGFILRAHGQGKRLVLVITGKGRRSDMGGPIPVRQGVLRHNVPHWLSIPPLSGLVMQVTNAHARHGGGGAYYVYLRRPR